MREGRSRAVLRAPVDQKAISGALAQIFRRRVFCGRRRTTLLVLPGWGRRGWSGRRRCGPNGGLDLRLDLIQWEKLQFPFRRRRGGYDVRDGLKTQHPDFNRPVSVRQIGEVIHALEIGYCVDSLIAQRCRHRRAGNRQSPERYLSAILCGSQEGDREQGKGGRAANSPRAFPHGRSPAYRPVLFPIRVSARAAPAGP